jgi:hypothetical protein
MFLVEYLLFEWRCLRRWWFKLEWVWLFSSCFLDGCVERDFYAGSIV